MRRFWGTVEVDHIHECNKLCEVFNGIVSQLASATDDKMNLSIEQAEAPGGFPSDVQMRVNENRIYLKLDEKFEPR